jgi:hypothetical protein
MANGTQTDHVTWVYFKVALRILVIVCIIAMLLHDCGPLRLGGYEVIGCGSKTTGR